MFAVVFQVHPAPGMKEEYLAHAKHLKPILESIDGFIDNERFESTRRQGWILSLSTWRDEKSVVRWRTQGEHHKTQGKGRAGIFSDYHLSICEVTTDSHPPKHLQVVQQRLDVTQVGEAKALAITEIVPAADSATGIHPDLTMSHLGLDAKAPGLIEYDVFESIYTPGKKLLLTTWKAAEDADRWTPKSFGGVAELRHRRLRNIRDYGMFDRKEAPQYFPDADRSARD
jgi:heme-degrading monooxygenase HmoA